MEKSMLFLFIGIMKPNVSVSIASFSEN